MTTWSGSVPPEFDQLSRYQPFDYNQMLAGPEPDLFPGGNLPFGSNFGGANVPPHGANMGGGIYPPLHPYGFEPGYIPYTGQTALAGTESGGNLPYSPNFGGANVPAHGADMAHRTYPPVPPFGFGPHYIPNPAQINLNNSYNQGHPSSSPIQYTDQLPPELTHSRDQRTPDMFDFEDFLGDLGMDEDDDMGFFP